MTLTEMLIVLGIVIFVHCLQFAPQTTHEDIEEMRRQWELRQ